MARPERFELRTFWFVARRFVRLSEKIEATKRAVQDENYYESTTVHHYGALEFPARLPEMNIKSGCCKSGARSSAG